MGLINSFKKNEITQVKQTDTTTAQAAQTSSSVSNTPIDFSSKNEKAFSEIVEFINSEEFKSLPPGQKKQALLNRFPALKTMSDEQIKQYVITAKQTVENQQQPEETETQTPETAEMENTANQSEFEKLVNQYIKETQFKGNIDELISLLCSKDQNNELSPLEKKILEKFVENEQVNTKETENGKQDKHRFLDELIQRMNKLLSDDKLAIVRNPNTSNKERLMIYADAFITKNDKKYAELKEPKAKQEYLDKKLSCLIPNWDKLTPKQKDEMIKDKANELIVFLQACDSSDKSLKDLENLTDSEYMNIICDYKQKNGMSLSPVEQAQVNIVNEIRNDNLSENVTYGQIITVLQQKTKNGTITSAESQLLEKYKVMHLMLNYSIDKETVPVQSLNDTMLTRGYNNIDEYLDKVLKPKMATRDIIPLISGADTEQLKIIEQKLTKLGYSPEQINHLFKEHNTQLKILDNSASVLVDGKDTEAISTATKVMKKYIGIETTKKYVVEQPHYIKNPDDLAEVGINMAEDKELTGSFASGLNKYRTDKEVVQISTAIASSQKVADANKAIFTRSVVETAPTAQRQILLGRELSKIGNAAVTEGLAAASNSVDQSVRNQYNSYVETAMRNYPPEQQAAIRTAMETGQISQQTLSKTTPDFISELSKTQQTLSHQQTYGSQQASKPQQSVSSQTYADRTVPTVKPSNTSFVPLQNNSAAIRSDNNTKTSITLTPEMSEEEVKTLAKQAEALLTKIENFQKDQAESIKLWEETQAQKSKISDIESIEEETSAIPDEVAEYANLELDESEKKVIVRVLTEIFRSNSLNRAFEELGKKFGENIQIKFLELLATKGNSSDIHSFAENFKSNPQIILTLFQFSQDQSLLRYLDNASILHLYYTGKITNIDVIKDRLDVITKIIEDGMKNGQNINELKNLITYLTSDYQGALIKRYPSLAENIPGTDEWINKYQNSQRNKTSVTQNTDTTDYETAFENKQDNMLFADNNAPMNPTFVSNPKKGTKYDKRKRNGHIYLA